MSIRLAGVATGLAVLSSSCATSPNAQKADDAVLAIVGVTVIDPALPDPEKLDQTILIRRGRIVSVGPRARVAVPQNAVRVRARGLYAIPGLWDSHVHLADVGEDGLALFVANGVTSVRDIGSGFDSIAAWNRQLVEGTLVGPRAYTSGAVLESLRYMEQARLRDSRLGGRLATHVLPNRIGVGTAEHVRRAIDSLAERGGSFVKMRTLESRAVLLAAISEAHRRGLKVSSHAPSVLAVDEAVRVGLDEVVHALGDLSDTVRRSLVVAAARGDGWFTPTLVALSATTRWRDAAAQTGNVRLPAPAGVDRSAYVTPHLAERWRLTLDEWNADTNTARTSDALRVLQAARVDVGVLAAAGARILAGTDAGWPLVAPGFSLHDELALLVEVGLTHRQALWSATVGAAQFVGAADAGPMFRANAVADLVLVDANPLHDVSNLRRIRAVVQAGALFDRARLDLLLESVRTRSILDRASSMEARTR